MPCRFLCPAQQALLRLQYGPRTLRPASPSVSSARVLTGASRSRRLRRIAGTAALDRGAQHSRKSWLENAAEQTRAPCKAARGKEITISINPRRETASPTLPRDKKRSFWLAAEDVATNLARSHQDPRAGPRSTPTTQWKSLESSRPPSPDSGRAAARRPGRAPGVESNRRFETHTKHAGHGQLPHARPADELQDETHDATTRQAARLRGAVGLAHGR